MTTPWEETQGTKKEHEAEMMRQLLRRDWVINEGLWIKPTGDAYTFEQACAFEGLNG